MGYMWLHGWPEAASEKCEGYIMSRLVCLFDYLQYRGRQVSSWTFYKSSQLNNIFCDGFVYNVRTVNFSNFIEGAFA